MKLAAILQEKPFAGAFGNKPSPLASRMKGPDNPTSQLLPKMSNKCCSGDGEGRKDKGGGGGKMVCDKVVCMCVKDAVVKDGVSKMDKVVFERWCVTKLCVKDGVCERWCVTKLCVKDGV